MCGIFGIVSLKPGVNSWLRSYEEIMTQGLYVTGLRGLDSTGLFTVHETKPQEVNYIKGPIDPMMFCDTKQYNKYVGKHFSSARYIIGHTRKATKGDIKWDNAHPFTYEGITLIHNGVLNNTYDFKDLSYDVDSQYIPAILRKHDKTEEAIGKLSGAFALIWYDAATETLNIIRNSQRTLAYYIDASADRMFVASEPEMLYMILRRNSVMCKVEDIEMFKPDHLYQVQEIENGNRITFTSEPMSFKESVTVTNYYGRGNYNTPTHQGHAGYWGGYNAVRAYKPSAWMLPIKFPVHNNEVIHIKDFTVEDYKVSTDGNKVKLVGEAEILTHNNAIATVPVIVYGVHPKFRDWHKSWQTAYKEGEFGFGARPYSSYFLIDANNGKTLHLDAGTIEGWRMRKGSRLYYEFDNSKGLFKKNGISEEIKPNVVDLPTKPAMVLPFLVKGPNGRLVDQEDFEKLTQDGCVSCLKSFTITEAEKIEWVEDEPYCETCNDIFWQAKGFV